MLAAPPDQRRSFDSGFGLSCREGLARRVVGVLVVVGRDRALVLVINRFLELSLSFIFRDGRHDLLPEHLFVGGREFVGREELARQLTRVVAVPDLDVLGPVVGEDDLDDHLGGRAGRHLCERALRQLCAARSCGGLIYFPAAASRVDAALDGQAKRLLCDRYQPNSARATADAATVWQSSIIDASLYKHTRFCADEAESLLQMPILSTQPSVTPKP